MRSHIVEAACKLVRSQGVAGVTLDDVMCSSNVSKSQIYHYFADKDGLIREVISLESQRVLSTNQIHLEKVDSFASLVRWRDAIIALNKAKRGMWGCPMGSLANELANQSESARKFLVEGFETWQAQITTGLRKMRDAGELRETADPAKLAIAVLCAIQGGLLLSKTARNTKPLELAFDMALEHVARELIVRVS